MLKIPSFSCRRILARALALGLVLIACGSPAGASPGMLPLHAWSTALATMQPPAPELRVFADLEERLVAAADATPEVSDEPAAGGGSAFDPAPDAASSDELGSPRLGTFPRQLVHNFGQLFSSHNVHALLLGGACFGAARISDEVLQGSGRPMHLLGDIGQVAGSAYVVGGISALMMAKAYHDDNQHLRRFSFSLCQGLLLSEAIVQTLKVTVARERPNHEDNRSFPSGHATTAFNVAAIISQNYGKKTTFAAYSAAVLIAASRMEKNKHFFSDVVAGGFLGHIIGRSVWRGTEHASRKNRLSLSPLLAPDGVGVAMRLEL